MSAAQTRAALEDAVERAIALLNAWDGDPDLEDGDEDDQCDDEGAYDGDNDTSDDEPSLCGIHMALSGGVGVYRDGKMHYDLEADGGEQ